MDLDSSSHLFLRSHIYTREIGILVLSFSDRSIFIKIYWRHKIDLRCLILMSKLRLRRSYPVHPLKVTWVWSNIVSWRLGGTPRFLPTSLSVLKAEVVRGHSGEEENTIISDVLLLSEDVCTPLLFCGVGERRPSVYSGSHLCREKSNGLQFLQL